MEQNETLNFWTVFFYGFEKIDAKVTTFWRSLREFLRCWKNICEVSYKQYMLPPLLGLKLNVEAVRVNKEQVRQTPPQC